MSICSCRVEAGEDAAGRGLEQKTVRFTTNIPYLTNWGQPRLPEPGSILVAHTKDEFVLKEDLETAVDNYVSLTRELLTRRKR